MTRLRGADTVIVGLQPEVAFAMVQLGLAFDDMHTALDLEEGLALLNRSSTAASRRSDVTVPTDFVVDINNPDDIVTARQAGHELARQLGFSLTDVTMIATAISEIARNITSYAGRGEIRVGVQLRDGKRRWWCGPKTTVRASPTWSARSTTATPQDADSDSGCPVRAV